MRQRAGTDLEEVLPLRGLQLEETEPGVSVGDAVKRLEASAAVLYAEPNRVRRALTVPNDEYFHLLWGLNNVGQMVAGAGGTPDADIDAPEAWDVTTGSASVTVGIADSGVDAANPDLAPNLWTNPGEVLNGLDDDGNGLVDDVHGWDWVGGDADPADANGHGTHVAGTIGAKGNDATGVTGVAWNVGLLPLRVLDASGQGSVASVVKGYAYASRKGVRVVNASLGSSGFSQAEHDAIAAASNTLFVVAAGNGGSDGVGDDNDLAGEYPCAYTLPNIVCVASTDRNDALSSFSNYGLSSVDLAAPGENVASTWLGSDPNCAGAPCWAFLSGTSMATPHVSGAAALILSKDPGASVAAVKSALLDTVDLKPSLAGRILTGGRLNAFRALSGAANAVPGGGSGGGTVPPVSETVPAPGPQPPEAPPSSPEPSPTPTPLPPSPQPQPAPHPTPSKPAPGVSVARDRTPPSVRVAFPRGQTIRSVLRGGLILLVRCSEACTASARMTVGSDGVRGGTAAARPIRMRLRPDAIARRNLRRARRRRIKVRVRVVDRAGNPVVLSRTVALR